MSEYEKKNNRGAAFINKNKDKPSQPDLIGTAIIDGKEKRLAFWKNKSADGAEYITYMISEPLSDEEKQNFRKPDMPAQAPVKKVEKQFHSKSTSIKNENNDMRDLEEILRLNDDDAPF